jgi:hypothetical protein
MCHSVSMIILDVIWLPSLMVALCLLLTLTKVHYHVLLLVMSVRNVISLRDVWDLWRVVWSKTTCLMNSWHCSFVRGWTYLVKVPLVWCSQLVGNWLFQILSLLPSVMSVIYLATLWRSLLILKVHVGVLKIRCNMMALQMILILKYQEILISVQ